jgi:histidinol-phosphatase (PHP family)
MIFDTHIHTRFSFDSAMDIVDALEQARKLGIGMVTSEHLDLNMEEVNGFEVSFDIEAYFRTYSPFRGKDLLLGIETGIDLIHAEENRKLVEGYPFDMVLGSMHTMKGLDATSTGNFRGMTMVDFFRIYLIEARKTVERNDFIDTLAHIDFPARYLRLEPRHVRYGDVKQEMDDLFSMLVEKDISLELNLKRRLDGEVYRSLSSILRGYHAQGGLFVTLGSDAHTCGEVGQELFEGLRLVEEIGLKTCYYKDRNRMMNSW